MDVSSDSALIQVLVSVRYEQYARLGFLGLSLLYMVWSVLRFSSAIRGTRATFRDLPEWIMGIYNFLMGMVLFLTWMLLVYIRHPEMASTVEVLRFMAIVTNVFAFAVGLWMTSFYYVAILREAMVDFKLWLERRKIDAGGL